MTLKTKYGKYITCTCTNGPGDCMQESLEKNNISLSQCYRVNYGMLIQLLFTILYCTKVLLSRQNLAERA